MLTGVLGAARRSITSAAAAGALDSGSSSWATSTGTNKSTWVTVSGSGNRAMTGTAGFANAPTSVRNPTERAGKRWIEYAVSNRSIYPLHVGLDDGTDYLGDGGTTNYTRPGKDNSTGIEFVIPDGSGYWQIWHGGSMVQSGVPTGNMSNGDRLGIEYDWDDATDTLLSVKFFTYKSGAWAQVGTTITNVSLSHCYANCAVEDSDTLTGAFAAADQIRTPTSGFVPYDNV